ncbi:MAG: hypothetical protein V3T05_00015 [Myxococcota bacterium]
MLDIEFTVGSIFVGFLVGVVGFALFLYGKRQSKFLHLITGIILMVYPYFVPDAVWMAVVGVGIIGGLFVATKII